jgi:hypothetical protein
MRPVFAALALCLLIPVAAAAQEEVAGTYVTYNLEQTITEQPDGSSRSRGTYEMFESTSDPDSLFNNTKSWCMGEDLLSESGEIISSAGACATHNPDGDTYWHWWRQEKAGTTDCPNACGSWGIFNGTGAFKAITGGGSWKVTATYPDQTGAGVWNLKYEKK